MPKYEPGLLSCTSAYDVVFLLPDGDTDDDFYYVDPIVIYTEEDGRSICP